MNPFELLKKDHEKVSELMKRLEKTTERGIKTRQDLFKQMKDELDVHAHIEETIFYPALQVETETEDIAREAFEEHRVVKTLLSELEKMPKDDEQWSAKFMVLKENVEHHVEEEEGEMFTKARKALAKDELEELGEEMDEEKKRMMAGVAE
ncbi:MAG: hemerythrin domain-containing protein [Acidobacteriota bacterium]